MSINVPPVTGKTPQQVALLMREKLKHMVQAGGGSAVHNLTPVYNRMIEYRTQANNYHDRVQEDLQAIRVAAARRKPSEIRALVSVAEGHLYDSRSVLGNERGRANRLYEYATTNQAGGAGGAAITELYSLVQALPTVENIPVGHIENSLRAITAIVKAHYGLLEGDVSEAPHEGGELALVDTLMKLVQGKAQAAPPENTNPQEVTASAA